MKKIFAQTLLIASILLLTNVSLPCQNLFYLGTGVPFLQFSPSASISSIGGAATSLPVSDPYNFFYNPAQLGFNEPNSLLLGINPNKIHFTTAPDTVGLNVYAISGSYDLSKFTGFKSKAGAGILYENYDFGEFSSAQDSIAPYIPTQSAVDLSLGFSLEYYATFGIGFSYKFINSKMYDVVNFKQRNDNVNVWDIGLLIDVPVFKKIELLENCWANANVSAGYTYQNGGDKYLQTGPLPKQASLGYGIRTDLYLIYSGEDIKVLSIAWTSEASDFLWTFNSKILKYETKGPLGDISLWDNVFMLKSNNTGCVNKHGIKGVIFEFLSLGYGKNAWVATNTKVDGESYGYGFRLKGALKLLKPVINNSITRYLVDHVDLSYDYANVSYLGSSGPFTYYTGFDEKYNSLSLWIKL